ncbi:tetratricopeptide repeat protein [Marinihelvus fidelis]|uniref:Tetratricopeptide repeat protein n=1 Tax=Marinihelvus fidelis TaxID=2613842 RepID=A0A5N0TBY9_9GAMM|nr:tetratricopeptide repeat protein [Marinihelvus fidelis]KAA9131346.1 tetratricopeptide repeat protein [Marinihelvus fidelis]
MNFLAELKRRNVFRAGIAYVLMGWVLLQGADFVLDLIGAPEWVIRALAVVIVVGLPITLFFAWAFEMTPEGLKRDHEVDRSQSITPQTGRKLDRAIIAFLAVALLLVLAERFFLAEPAPVPEQVTEATSEEEAGPPPDTGTSLAVLAFENMSPDPENEFFADGISEEILNVLSGLEDLRVIARTSAFSFKGSGATVAEIAGKLDVSHVLEGSVRRAGNRVRVTAQLIETNGESHLWSETYDRDLDDIFAVQDEIARAITRELQLQLTPEQENLLVAQPTDNLEAYNKYLQGRQLWHSRGPQNLQAAAILLQDAVELDPGFAEAWAALADTWLLIPEYSPTRTLETIPPARDAVNRALELKPGMPQALTTRAYIRFMYDFDWDNAARDFERAIELDPDYPTAQQWYGEYLAVRNRDTDAALAQFRKAAQMDPLAPVMWNVSGWVAAQAGRLEESNRYYERTLEIEPGFLATYANLTLNYIQLGEYEHAREMWVRAAALGEFDTEDGFNLIEAMHDPTARQAYIEGLATNPNWRSGAVDRAFVYMLLGEEERAMADLERGLEVGDPYAAHANRMTIYDPLRDDPRFQAYLAKMNLWPPED